jgi:hypothetical protein
LSRSYVTEVIKAASPALGIAIEGQDSREAGTMGTGTTGTGTTGAGQPKEGG